VDLDRQPILVGPTITLRPLSADDFDALYAIASDPLLWEQHPAKDRIQEPVFRQWLADALASRGALVAVDKRDGRGVGTSRYDFFEGDVEIGWTFLARQSWGSGLNGEMKQLMLQHAFAAVDVVVFRVHSQNFRSQHGVAKLGAQPAGTQTDPNGHGTNLVYRLTKE
jgi:RimJ/RimL family protein N-acetyltransferase